MLVSKLASYHDLGVILGITELEAEVVLLNELQVLIHTVQQGLPPALLLRRDNIEHHNHYPTGPGPTLRLRRQDTDCTTGDSASPQGRLVS